MARTGLPDDLYQVCDGAMPPEGMRRMLRNAVQLFRVRRENDRMSFEMRFMARKPGARTEPEAPIHDEGLGFESILRSPASPMAATVAEARHLASFDIPVLLTGPGAAARRRWRRPSTARPCAPTARIWRST
jgi:two-component system response regulator HupR/HoxA